ncbi:YqcC family protein [Vibrio algarum]|uniref:YqcC family protein n=1 Tax=Vibrio algarum TaxID=3020714 RepID=A0ABT4YSX5_9VIBR|nr:YqcC family protein [Vibrio sp. KJ40-1]MDB1124623.1 YqcC family protein [Vibrio sp. KJ40-1]
MTNDLPLFTLLLETETCLRRLSLWGNEQPEKSALLSKEPFALDTLEPEQWLQWIFIPKMREMLESQLVPSGFSISPYFEEVWKTDSVKLELIALLHQIDEECR